MSLIATVGYAVGALVLAGGSLVAGKKLQERESEDPAFEQIDGLEEGEGFAMSTAAAGDSPGLLSSYRRDKRKRSALKKGMVRWHLLDTGFSKPMYVKPERESGESIPKVEYEDETYLFPEEASMPAEEEGVPVFVHRRDEADPINLRDSWDDAISASALNRYLDMAMASEEPDKGMFDGDLLGMDPMTIFRYGILALVGFAIVVEALGGGLV